MNLPRIEPAISRGIRWTRFSAAVFVMLTTPATAAAQSGVPGARLESGRDHRAAVRAEAYASAARFFAQWREAWNNGEADALLRLYTEDAIARLPGEQIVRGQEPLQTAVRKALATPSVISTSDLDFDSDGERCIVVARYVQQRNGRALQGIVTAVLYRHRASWRMRMHVFDAPETPVDGDPSSDN